MPKNVKSRVSQATSDGSFLNSSDLVFDGHATTADDKNMYVESCDRKTKYNACLFCQKKVSKLPRHLTAVHKDELQVKKLLTLPKKSSEKVKMLDILRKEGNLKFNKNVNVNKGELIVIRRSKKSKKKTAMEYTACVICKGFFSKKSLSRHFKRCSGRKNSSRCVLALGRLTADRIHKVANTKTRLTVSRMREDNVTRLIRYDELLMSWTNKLTTKYTLDHHSDMIRARLRLLGRFLHEMQKIEPDIENFSNIYDPKYYDSVIKAVNVVAGYDPEENIYKAPSNGSNLGTWLKMIGKHFISLCVRSHDNEKKINTENFLNIHEEEFSTEVNRTVAETQLKNDCKKKTILPTDSDIQKLTDYLDMERRQAYQKLRESFTPDAWKKLSESTLLSIQLFNRRRPGEIERVLIEDYKSHETLDIKSHQQLYESLSPEAQAAVKKYVRFTIRGKLARKVSVLLSSELVKCIDLILSTRNEAKVNKKNPYVFGIQSYDTKRNLYLRSCQLMRQYSVDCGAENPISLRGTKLRKHIATKCISLKLTDNQVSVLADHLGHHKDIHKKYYQQPIPALEIVKVSKILEAAAGNGDVEEENESEEEEIMDIDEINETESFTMRQKCKRMRKFGKINFSLFC